MRQRTDIHPRFLYCSDELKAWILRAGDFRSLRYLSDYRSSLETKAMRAAATTSQGSEFQDFLYAPICQDQEGMTLSVLSALARQDVDPWTEAARLSQLPKETATKQITDLCAGRPARSRR